jgi:hypothetical protein
MPENRTVVVCLPATDEPDWFTASERLDWHNLPAGRLQPIYPVRRTRRTDWLRRRRPHHDLLPVVRHVETLWTAGGRKELLDLPAAVTAANANALHRWQVWTQVVRGTASARPWADFLAQHTANPRKVSLDEARRRFEGQPRVLAMLAYNAHLASAITLDPYQLEAFQAGADTYACLHWRHAVVGDALITHDGRLLQPTGPGLADRLRYYADAGQCLNWLDGKGALVALKVAGTTE